MPRDGLLGCDAGPTLNRNLVGMPTSFVRGTSWASIEEMLASPANVVEGIHV